MTTIIETERLILRTWRKEDAEAYFQINQDPKVIELLRGPLTMEQVNDFIPAVNKHQEKHGYTLWAVELKETGELIGFIGLNYTDWESHFTPTVEVGWRLGSQYWGKGFATEGAKASLDYGFKQCGLKEIVSFTVPVNIRSIRVMEKIGLKRDVNGDFAHPKLPADHPLSQHILYRLTVDEYFKQEIIMSTIEYSIENNPDASDDKVIRNGIVDFNSQIINEKATHFSVFAKDDSQIIGGALIWEHSDALYIDVLWCNEQYRKQGIGTKIITMIDGVAKNKGLPKIFVDTYAFQAQDFYKKHGFYCIGIVPEYMLGHDRIFMRKDVS